jgi:hypothetical protein
MEKHFGEPKIEEPKTTKSNDDFGSGDETFSEFGDDEKFY